jgi:energy-coupling factor transporter ATP-binding protein EcfA2
MSLVERVYFSKPLVASRTNLKINVEESIRGLWLAPGNVSYLAWWFRRLDSGQLIPLSPGINVFYGRNGAGKTQILEAIAHAAEFKMSAYEGFLLSNPIVSQMFYSPLDPKEKYTRESYGKEFRLFDVSPEVIIAWYVGTDTEDTWLGQTMGFNAHKIDDSNRDVVVGILKEFIAGKNVLLTRSPTKEVPNAGDPSSMNLPEFIQLVPTLLPSDNAPLTRKHAKQIHSSFLEYLEEIETKFPDRDYPELTVDEIDELHRLERLEQGELFEKWVEEWSWSPLINLRNLGHDNFNSFVENEEDCNLWDSDNLPIFLPAIVSYDQRPEYEEFTSSSSTGLTLSLTRESGVPITPNFYSRDPFRDELSEIENKDINYENEDRNSEGIDKPEVYNQLLANYLVKLRTKLKFLPNFRGLDFRKSEYERNPYLVVHENILASRGSAAERRWLHLARVSMGEFTQWVVIDEPEAGLHRSAEAELARALSSDSWNRGSVVVVATHSPEFLDLPNAHVLHIDDGRVRELSEIDREDLISLGLRPGDLLTQVRTFLLVEGEHERIIFENLFHEELRRAGCKIVVARGGRSMKDVFESQMIFNFSDATVLCLLDNIESKEINSIWSESKRLAEKADLIQAGQYIRSSLPGSKSSENVFLSQFLTLALANGQHERVEVWGLSKADISLYFEPSNFGLKRSWQELLEIHSSSDPSFKEWATKKYGADFTVQAIDRASKSMDSIPDEFVNLIMRINELSSPS